jgi:hypothetical protein
MAASDAACPAATCLLLPCTACCTAAEKANLYYGDVEVVVLDEADTMFDRGFGPEVKAILAAVRSKPEPARCVLVSATMTKAVRKLVGGCCWWVLAGGWVLARWRSGAACMGAAAGRGSLLFTQGSMLSGWGRQLCVTVCGQPAVHLTMCVLTCLMFSSLQSRSFPGMKQVETSSLPVRFLLLIFSHWLVYVLLPAEEEFPGMKQVETSSLHRGVAGARHSFLPLPGFANKLDVLLQVRLLPLLGSGSASACRPCHADCAAGPPANKLDVLLQVVLLSQMHFVLGSAIVTSVLLPSLCLGSAFKWRKQGQTRSCHQPPPCPPARPPAGHPGGARPWQAPHDLLQHAGQLPRR